MCERRNIVSECTHTITQGRQGETGSWCTHCGVKVFDVDAQECGDCASAKKLVKGWICNRHMMAITTDMHVTFKISEGSCWTKPNNVTGETS